MLGIRTPVRLGEDGETIFDSSGKPIVRDAIAEESTLGAIVDAVNREAEHAEAVRRLTEQRDKLLAVCKAVATECPVCGSTDLRRDADLGCSTMWCDDCGAGNNHAMLARAAIAAAEGGGT